MEKNKFRFIILLIIIICLLGGTIYKIVKKHEEKLYKSFYGGIEHSAKQCFLTKKCNGETTLKELYELNFLETQYNPITKEILDENIKIEYKNEKIIIDGEEK